MPGEQVQRNVVIDQEFGPELAGYRIGRVHWAEVELSEDRGQLMYIEVATAVVGTEGATISHIETEGRYGFSDGQMGSLALGSAVGITARKGAEEIASQQWSTISSRMYPYGSGAGRPTATHILHSGAVNFPEGTQVHTTWFRDTETGLAELKSVLEYGDLSAYYEEFYFRLNHGILHPGMRPDDYDRLYLSSAYWDKAMASPAMHEETKKEHELAIDVAAILSEQLASTATMHRTLSFARPVESTVESFVESRRSAHSREVALRGIEKAMTNASGVYWPIEFGGRSWPYMDASSGNEEYAFGKELNALKHGSAGRAAYELERELSDLGRRVEHAVQGMRSLRILSNYEETLIEQTLPV